MVERLSLDGMRNGHRKWDLAPKRRDGAKSPTSTMRSADWVVPSGWVLDQPVLGYMRPYHTICLSFSDPIYNYLPVIQQPPGPLYYCLPLGLLSTTLAQANTKLGA